MTHLEAITDSALDCTYLLITGATPADSVQQSRLLLEQRSTGYSWPCEQAVEEEARCEGTGRQEEVNGGGGGAARSRLSGLKQVSED